MLDLLAYRCDDRGITQDAQPQKPLEELWTVETAGHERKAFLYPHPTGFEVRIVDVTFATVETQTFPTEPEAEAFSQERYRELLAGGMAVVPDIVTLKDELARADELERAGGPAYLARLVDGIPRATNVEYYAGIVRRTKAQRELAATAAQLQQDAYADAVDPLDIAHSAEASLIAISTRARSTGGLRPIADHLEGLVEHMTELSSGRRKPGLETGLSDLDALIIGLRPGLTLLAGRTSKSAKERQSRLRRGRSAGLCAADLSRIPWCRLSAFDRTRDEIERRPIYPYTA